MSAYLEPLEEGRCKKWKLIVSVGSGRDRRRKTKLFVGGKREALAALKEFEQITHIPVVRSGFEAFATRWNDARFASGSIAESTHEKYYWHIHAVSPYLSKNLEDIRPSDIQAAYAALRGSWSGTTLRSMHNSLLRIFRAAQDEGLIGSNPVLSIDPPKIDTKEKRALAPREVVSLLDRLDMADNRQFAIYLILSCGLRRAEVLGLEWRDIGKTIHVRREITKSDSGVRDIPLDDETVKVIEKRRQLVSTCLEGVGDKLRPGDRLCCGLDGRPLTANALRLWWQRNNMADGLTLHELRHTFLTNLAQAGVHPAVMQKLAGHASINTTMKIYTHVNNDDMVEAVQNVAKLRQSAPQSAPRSKQKKTGQDTL